MFKSWSKKKKIKAIFQLQFQATQVPKLKKPALMLSLVPDDVGKPTVKLGKAAVEDGTCIWENPIYESVKLIEEAKSGKLKEKIYHFIVSTGSSKSGYLGEASIDFADMVEEIEPLTVTLPLKFANSGIVLHVTICRIQEDGDQREFEEGEDPSLSRDSSLGNQNSHWDTDGSNRLSFNENGSYEKTTNVHEDVTSSVPENGKAGVTARNNHAGQKLSLDWSSDGSSFDSPNSVQDKLPSERPQAGSADSIEKLRNEIALLIRQADLSELELQSLRKQMAKESQQGQNLSRQISSLKEERDALKIECEQLKSLQGRRNGQQTFEKLQPESKDTSVELEAMKQELSYEKKARANLHLKLQKTQDTNSELILVVKDLRDALGKKKKEVSDLSSQLETEKNSRVTDKYSPCKTDEDENQRSLEKLGQKNNHAQEVESFKVKIRELLSEIDTHEKKREEQDMYIKQITSDYDSLKKDNHNISSKFDRNQDKLRTEMENERAGYIATIKELESQVQRSEETIEKQAHEFSECLMSIQELESEVRSLEIDMEKQAKGFEDKLEATSHAKVEEEKRAIQAEEALRKTRWNNSVTTERLQEELKRLSVEMASKVDENEKLATKAMTEANELRQQNTILEELLLKANQELELTKDQNDVKLKELSNQIDVKSKHIHQISLELDDKSKRLEDAKKGEEDQHEARSMENQMLKADIERLTERNSSLACQEVEKLRGYLEQMKKTIAENEMVIQRLNVEKSNLEERFASAQQETEKTQGELTKMRSLKHEKEKTITCLLSEMENLRTQHNEFKDTLGKEALAKESLRKQILQLQAEVKKDVRSSTTEKKLKNSNGRAAVSDRSITSSNGQRKVEGRSEKEMKCDQNNYTELLPELTLLKERNQYMEKELKEMEERYSEISLRFAEVEGERQQLVMTLRNLRNSKK